MANTTDARREYWDRASRRTAPVWPMGPVREGATLDEVAAWYEAEYTNLEYLAVSREYGFFHPLTKAMSEYRAISQTLHADMEYSNAYGCAID